MALQSVTAARASVVPVKTKAELAFASNFAALSVAGGVELPGSSWVARVRREAMDAFQAQGLPSRRVEAFKYTDLRERMKDAWARAGAQAPVARAAIDAGLGPLASLDAFRIVFVDGVFRPELSDLAGLTAAGGEAMPLAPLLAKAPSWLEGKFAAGRLGAPDALTLLNTAFMSDGLMLKIKPAQSAPKAVLIVMARASAEPSSTALRHIIAMEAGAKLTLLEAHVALPGASVSGLANGLVDITVADGAALEHVACVMPGVGATHLSNVIAKVGADASYRTFQLTCATGLARNGLHVTMGGTGSKLDISGAFLAQDRQHIDTTLIVDHAKPGCESRELFKCVLDDRARGVFQGKIIVQPGADQTDGKQMAKALMLSEDAEFDSKPELEIFADDVACGHGATVAELDPALMFYCQSRGIEAHVARALLIEAFIGEAIDKIADEPVREALLAVSQMWLRQEAAKTAA
jgi:Fe-S cluster assembly protein SufD